MKTGAELGQVGTKKRSELAEVGRKKGAGFESDPHFETMLEERAATPKAYEWRHSLAEKRQAEAYAEAKRKATHGRAV